jgi:hypothetical protein
MQKAAAAANPMVSEIAMIVALVACIYKVAASMSSGAAASLSLATTSCIWLGDQRDHLDSSGCARSETLRLQGIEGWDP